MTKNDLDIFIKWILGGVLVLAAIYFFPWGDITWGKLTLKNEGVVTVSGYAESNEKNQIAQFNAGVNAISDVKETAVAEVNAKMAEIVAAVKKLGVESEDIKTQQMNTYQMQENVNPMMIGQGKVKLGQWSASNSIEITLRDVDQASELADVLNASGATNVYGPNFQLDTSKKADDKLVEAAVADAKLKAELMARASGARLGRVISIVEGSQGGIAYPMSARSEMAKMDLAVPAPMEVGTSRISKTVTVVWSLR